MTTSAPTTSLYNSMKQTHLQMARAERDLLEYMAQADEEKLYTSDYFEDSPGWVAATFGISRWLASRWIDSGYALRSLPVTAAALADGTLAISKVLELTRFATPDDEAKLVRWARKVSAKAIRDRADEVLRGQQDDRPTIEKRKSLRRRWLDDGMFHLEAYMSSDQGAVVDAALDELLKQLPETTKEDLFPGESQWAEDYMVTEARDADALELLASGALGGGKLARHTVVVHAPLSALTDEPGPNGRIEGGRIEGGPAITPEMVKEMACCSDLSVIIEDDDGLALGIGRKSKKPPRWLERAVRYRDKQECTFPGCGRRSNLISHHMHWWDWGGHTDLHNLVSVCPVHHRYIHRLGWRVALARDGTTHWFKPDGILYDPAGVYDKTRSPGAWPEEARPYTVPEMWTGTAGMKLGNSVVVEFEGVPRPD